MLRKNRIEDLKCIKQAYAGNLVDSYTIGLYNGIETALALLENREPMLEPNIYAELKEIKPKKEERGRTMTSGIRKVCEGGERTETNHIRV